MDIVSHDIDEIYRGLCSDLINYGLYVNGTVEMRNVRFTLADIGNNVVSIRGISKPYLLGELLWYFNGRRDVAFISKFASLWSRISDDGDTNNSAYGYILKYKYGFDQVEKIIELLTKDPDSRRAVLNINEANARVIETKDEPCTIAIQFMIRCGKLYCTAMMRSNDIWFGLPYDVVFFTELQKYVAARLGVQCGTYTHFAVSLHAYMKDLSKILDIANANADADTNALAAEKEPRIHIDIMALQNHKEHMANEVMTAANPKEEIVELARRYKIIEESY